MIEMCKRMYTKSKVILLLPCYEHSDDTETSAFSFQLLSFSASTHFPVIRPVRLVVPPTAHSHTPTVGSAIISTFCNILFPLLI